jgi:hypothetical protein
MPERESVVLPPEHPERLEPSDVPARPLVIFAIAAVAGTALTILLLYWVFSAYQARAREEDRTRTRTAVPSAAPVPPEPRLQGVPGLHPNSPKEDLREIEESSKRILESYGGTRDEGFVRIPIERAMELVLERGLPEGR